MAMVQLRFCSCDVSARLGGWVGGIVRQDGSIAGYLARPAVSLYRVESTEFYK